MAGDEKGLTHLDAQGAAHMVDVGEKADTPRRAVAEALVSLSLPTLELLERGAPKGDVLAVARVAGIQATKRTSSLIPLCHALSLSRVTVDFEISRDPASIRILCGAECKGPTGVEMEALTGASVAALTLYDMLKAVDRGMSFQVKLLEKTGGLSGSWVR